MVTFLMTPQGLRRPVGSTFRRLRALSLATVAAVGFMTSPLSATAQDQLAPTLTPSTPAAMASDEPVLVVKIASLNELTADVNYLTAMVNQPNAGGMFGMMAGSMLRGVDPTKPIVVAMSLDGQRPMPLAMLPTENIDDILQRLEGQIGPAEMQADGTRLIAMGTNSVYIKQNSDYAVMAPTKEMLATAPADPMGLIEGMEDGLLTIRGDVQAVPEDMRQMLMDQLRQGFDQAAAQASSNSSDADAEKARDAARAQLEQIERLMKDADELAILLDVDQSEGLVRMGTKFTVVPGSDLSEMYNGYEAADSKFGSVVRDDAAAYYFSAATIPEAAIEQMQSQMETSQAQIAAALDQAKDLEPQQREAVEGLLNDLLDQFAATAAKGRFDMGMLVLADESKGQMVFGSTVADGSEVADALQDFAAKFGDGPDVPEFKFNIGEYNGVTLHQIVFETPEDDDKLRGIFGDPATIHLGTGPDYIYAAVGSGSPTLMKQLIDAPLSPPTPGGPIGQMKIKVLPMLEFARGIQSSDELVAVIDELLRAPDPGVISFEANLIPNGSTGEMTLGEGVLKAIGAAITQAQAKQRGGF